MPIPNHTLVNPNELRAERADVFAAAEKLIANARATGKDLSKEEQTTHTTLIARLKQLDAQLAKQDAVTANVPRNPGDALGGPNNPEASGTWRDDRGNPVRVLAKGESFRLAVPHAPQANFGFGDWIKGLVRPSDNADVRAALSESGGGATGDYTVPVVLLPQLIDLMRAKAVCVQAGAVTVPLETEVTNLVRIAADPTPAWRNESAAFAAADPTFEQVQFKPQSLGVLVKASLELLEDSANINDALAAVFAGAFAAELDRVSLFGTGTVPQPHGISGTSGVGSVSMGANGAALTNYDPFCDAIQALLNANAAMPTAAIMSPRTLVKSAKLKDSQNQPLRKPDLLTGVPFMGTTSVPNNQTQGSSSVASEIIVGDFTQLMLGIRNRLRITVLRERYWADNGMIGFVADLRADIQLRHPQSFCEIVGVL